MNFTPDVSRCVPSARPFLAWITRTLVVLAISLVSLGTAFAARLTATTTTILPETCIPGSPCPIKGRITPTGATGTVTIRVGSTVLGTTPTYLTADASQRYFWLNHTFATPQTLSVTATYNGDSTFAPSTSPVTVVNVVQYDCSVNFAMSGLGYDSAVSRGELTLQARPGERVRIPVTVHPTGGVSIPCTGSLNLKDGASTVSTISIDSLPEIDIGNFNGMGKATAFEVTPAAGVHNYVVSYSGDTTHKPSASRTLRVVADGTTAARSDMSVQVMSATYFDGVTLKTFRNTGDSFDGTGFDSCLQPKDAGYFPYCTYVQWPGGSWWETATLPSVGIGNVIYQAVHREWEGESSWYAAPYSYGVLDVPVTIEPTTTRLQLDSGTSALTVNSNLSFGISATTLLGKRLPDTEIIRLYDGETVLQELKPGACHASTGFFSCSVKMTQAGTRSLKLVYGGKVDAQGRQLALPSESAPVNVVVTQVASSTGLSLSSSNVEIGRPVTLVATVNGNAPSGAVTFKDGGTTIGTATLNAQRQATATYAFSSVGEHTISAEYAGDAANSASASPLLTLTVGKRAATVSLTLNPAIATLGSTVSLSAIVDGFEPDGNVTFFDGATVLGTRSLDNSSAAYLVSQISGVSGSHAVRAEYSGNANNLPATSGDKSLLVQDDTPKMRWRFEYDADGAITRKEQPNGKATTILYNGLKQPRLVNLPLPGASLGLEFDKRGNLKSLSDPRGITTLLTVDGLDNSRVVDSPDAGRKTRTYDAAGNLATITDARGKVTTFGYDAANRLTSITYATGAPTIYEYDGGPIPVAPNIGQLTKVTDESGTTTFSFDADGRPLSRIQVANGKTFANAYTYGTSGTSNGKLVGITYPGKAKVNYGYDAYGRIAQVQVNPVNSAGTAPDTARIVTLLSGITYAPTGQVTGWTWGDGTVYTRTFDEFGRPETYPLGKESGTGTAAGSRRTLVYGDSGLIDRMNHANNGVSQAALNQTFGHDDLRRLTQATVGSATTYGYGYDLGDNRITLTVGGTAYTQTIASGSNRLMVAVDASGSKSLQYDAAGNVTSDGNATYSYSDRGRMATATIGANTVAYKYNGFGQRVLKSGPTAIVPTGAAYYAYDEAGQVLGEYDANQLPMYEIVYLGGTPVGVLKYAKSGSKNVTWSNSYSYIYGDHLGTPRVVVRSTDHAIQWRWDTAEPFGMTAPNANPSGLGVFALNLRFPGQVFDVEIGSFYNNHRDYSPRQGRYVQSDPLGVAVGANTFGYVGASPLEAVDPQGLQAMPLPGIGGFPTPPHATPGTKENRELSDVTHRAIRESVGWLQRCFKGMGEAWDRMFSGDGSEGSTGSGGSNSASLPPEGPENDKTGGGSRVDVRIVERDGDVVKLEIQTQKGTVEAVGSLTQAEGRLTLSGFHIEGPGANSFSISELRQMARTLGQQQGADSVTIQGGVRNGGWNIGRFPRDITIKVPR